MAHRWNCTTNRVEPKPSASERTWSRFRIIHEISNREDEKRLDRLQQVKDKVGEMKNFLKSRSVK